METGKIILEQLGKQTLFMLGCSRATVIENGIKIKIGRHPKYNYIDIVLMPDDTYKMSFIKYHNYREVRRKERAGIYNDMLHETIREETGMATHLPRFAKA